DISHGLSLHSRDFEAVGYDDPSKVEDADLIVVVAGFPRKPDMSRRELAGKNAGIIKSVVEKTMEKNPDAIYFIVTNPVDALATLAANTLGDPDRVIGTGTMLDTARFRYVLARELNLPVSSVEGYIGGEHGEAAVPLWSTVYINGRPVDEYDLDKDKVFRYVRDIAAKIIAKQGATLWGPAGAFIHVIRGILLNTGVILSYARQYKFDNIPEPVYLTVPSRIGRGLRDDIWNRLWDEEKAAIKKSAEAIYQTYSECLEALKGQ
ncbi:TPA: hypothetical protein EYP83_00985, partial [Candidatus Geothermarchaeota archaeon]|nr:hypothetical protein [Candidatus Geothermarchaeota archaeon]